MRAEILQAKSLLDAATTITIIAHQRPDGDAIGSLLALTLALEKSGKHVTPLVIDGVPNRFAWLPGVEKVHRELPADPGLIITVDCSELERVGYALAHGNLHPAINIDHHTTNTYFASVNLVNPHSSATAEVIYDLAPYLSLTIDTSIATNLLAGLLTDTIGFRTSNVTPKVLRMAADLFELGAPLQELYERSLSQRTYEAAQYWGYGLTHLEREGVLAWTILPLEVRKQLGYDNHDDADLINLLTTIQGVEITIVFIEQPGRKVKISWRSVHPWDVAHLAENFGGGGHARAAGAMVQGDLDQVIPRVLAATRLLFAPIPEAKG